VVEAIEEDSAVQMAAHIKGDLEKAVTEKVLEA
jgi:hypothetical protein